jgi:hypothetical protein
MVISYWVHRWDPVHSVAATPGSLSGCRYCHHHYHQEVVMVISYCRHEWDPARSAAATLGSL